MTRKVIVVTNCTNRKRAGGASVTLATIGGGDSLTSVAARWAKVVQKVPASRLARDVYMGRAFTEARRVAETLEGALHIISAGLGVVGALDPIPSYDLTVSDSTNSLKPLLFQLGKEPSDWWTALTAALGGQCSVRALLEREVDALVLFAMPGSYVNLIAEDLASLTKSQISKIRIITSDHGQKLVPGNVRHVVLPYDERLEGSSYAGTRTDFPHRALRHFIEVLDGHQLSLKEAKAAVLTAMSTLKKPLLPVRERKTDAEILALLRKDWDRFDGASARLLRYLRDEALVACEQSRFRNLWCVLKQELTMRGSPKYG